MAAGTELGCEAHGIHNCEVVAEQSRRSEGQLRAKRAGGGEGEVSRPRTGLTKSQ